MAYEGSNPRPRVELRGRRPAHTPPKPKAWSHQDDLKELMGKKVALLFLDDTSATGELIVADQFTIKIASHFHDGLKTRIFFKSALQGFWEVQ